MSKTALAVLGLASEEPKHGYEIIQDIRERGMDHWVQLNTASVYNTLNRLEQDGYITETKIKIGNTPERKVYQVNPSGTKLLSDLVEQYIVKNTYMGHHFRLAVAFLDYLDPAKAIKSLKKRLKQIETHFVKLEKDYAHYKDQIPFNWIFLMECGLDHMTVEKKLAEKLVSQLEVSIAEDSK